MSDAVDDDSLQKVPQREIARLMLSVMRPEALLYTVAIGAAFLSSLLGAVPAFILRTAIDGPLTNGDGAGLTRLAFAYLIVTVLAFGLDSAYTISISYAAIASITRLRRRVYEHTLGFSQSFWDKRPTGRLLSRVTSDVEALSDTLTAGAITIVLDVGNVLWTVVGMLVLSWRLTLVAALLAPVIFVVVEVLRRILQRLYTEIRSSLSALNAYTAERLAGVEVVQLHSDEKRATERHDALLDVYIKANVRTNLWDALLYAIMDGLVAIAVGMMLFYGTSSFTATDPGSAGVSAAESVVTAGLLAAFVRYIQQLFQPIQEFSAKVAILQRAGASLDKIAALLLHREHIGTGDLRVQRIDGQIVVKDLGFAYGDGPTVLDGVSFRVEPGEVVAIVGRTGSGKSSIAKVLQRMYDGYRGSVTFDGNELSRIHPDDVRRNVGMVRQDVQLFPGDVRFNLTLGSPIPDDRLWDAIKLVQAEELVGRLGGLDGQIAHQGSNLSVGEAQLLSFARVMAHDPPVVLLDEATASVDSLTEARIQAATRAVFERKTAIVVAHRLSTVVDADRIVVLDHGRVLEMGSHAELIAKGGAWAELYRHQFEEASP